MPSNAIRFAGTMLLVFATATAQAIFSSAARADNRLTGMMIEGDIRGRRVEGLPLRVTSGQVDLLSRDGYLWEFRPDEATGLHKTSLSFRSYSFPELRSSLERELAGRLELTATSHYLVAHPRGSSKWPERFEELYRSFMHYFTVRGLKLQSPEFPLVALVWPSQIDFLRYAQSQGQGVGPGVLGFYSPVTNRIMLYDSSVGPAHGAGSDSAWQQDAATVIHEATHQTAFNTGVHNRFSQPPRWLAEGLGMLFEARGTYDSRHWPGQEDRVNRGRLTQFRQYLAGGRRPGAFLGIVESDRLFETNPGAAYAEAWALTFYLSETRPRQYNAYLALTAARKDFEPYTAARRRADFTATFAVDPRMLEADYLRYIANVK
ncbi:MAG TPA: DUF1570 domain-containing protein [Pirellulales bacterium]|nr:DUF1570 domain-containing protein [Pirellulales bacterium]